MAKLTENLVMIEMQPELGTLAPVVAAPLAAAPVAAAPAGGLAIPPRMATALPAAVRAELARLPAAKQDEFALA